MCAHHTWADHPLLPSVLHPSARDRVDEQRLTEDRRAGRASNAAPPVPSTTGLPRNPVASGRSLYQVELPAHGTNRLSKITMREKGFAHLDPSPCFRRVLYS